MASVSSNAPSRRARAADTACSKKIQTWPPFPDRERSSAAGTARLKQAAR